jgi:hypothetical protein
MRFPSKGSGDESRAPTTKRSIKRTAVLYIIGYIELQETYLFSKIVVNLKNLTALF